MNSAHPKGVMVFNELGRGQLYPEPHVRPSSCHVTSLLWQELEEELNIFRLLQELEDFVGAKFYCLYTLADSNKCIQIREKTLEFSSTVLSTLSLKMAEK